jgi:uncharacterized membrane protein (DUF2068 family)
MEVFFIKYRKLLIVSCIFLLIYLPFEIYRSITTFGSNTGQAIGILLNACLVFLFVPIYMLIKVHKASREFKEENAAIDSNNDNRGGV